MQFQPRYPVQAVDAIDHSNVGNLGAIIEAQKFEPSIGFGQRLQTNVRYLLDKKFSSTRIAIFSRRFDIYQRTGVQIEVSHLTEPEGLLQCSVRNFIAAMKR